MFGLFLDPAIFCGLLYVVAKRHADFDFFKVFFVSLGMGIGIAAILLFLVPAIGVFALIPAFLLALFLLVRFCRVTPLEGTTVLVVFVVVKLLLNLVWQAAFS